jgi:endothelin-converting enzyme/putative endopeptidase
MNGRVRAGLAIFVLLLTGFADAAGAADNTAPLKGIELSDIDRKVEACTDFFEFSNGAWRANNPMPASMSRWSRRWKAGEESKERLKEILDATAAMPNPKKGSVDQQIGDLYGACMNQAERNRLGVKPLGSLIAEIDALSGTAALQKMIPKFTDLNISAPFGFGSASDSTNPSDVIAQISAGGLGLPDRDYYFKTEPRFVEAREKYVAHVAKIFGLAGYSAAESKAAAATVMRMETQLAEDSLDNVALRDPYATEHKTAFADLSKMTPRFDWPSYFKAVGVAPVATNVTQPKFLAEFDRQLAETKLADWKVYLKWRLLDSAAPYLADAFVDADFAFYGAYLNGAREQKPAWKLCAESTDNLLGEALGKKYVEKYFPPEAKARMQELVKNLRLAMQETIEGLEWMSAATKTKALEKLSTFNPMVGYPDKWKDYGKVSISRADYWSDVVAGRTFNVEDDLSTIGKPVDRLRWGMTPPTSNAYYNPLLNEIVFPAGILQPPAFSVDANDAVNYGAIGVVIGHEISHGFDDHGAQYDAQGRLQNWWSKEDLEKFQAKTRCIVEQYDAYEVEPGVKQIGKLVAGESIGDLAGARIAYRAFQIAQKGKPPMPDVGGFTPDQQFFIAWGQFRGDAVRPELARTMAQGDPHPIGKYRVIGSVSNLPEFAKAFGCKPGDPMVRAAAARCDVW